ncbi:hypothetical protein D3C76_1171490 [compost metagenome]
MDQARRKRRRLVQLAPAQAPLDDRVTARQLIQKAAVLLDADLDRIGDRSRQEAQPRMVWRDAMQQGQVTAQLLAQRATRSVQVLVRGQAVATGGTAERLHDEEVAAYHGRLPAEPQRLRHLHAGLVHSVQHRELLLPAHAHRHRRRRIGAQYPTAFGLPRTVADAPLQQPVLLDCATGKALAALDLDLLAVQPVPDEIGQGLVGIWNVDPDISGSMGMGAVHR